MRKEDQSRAQLDARNPLICQSLRMVTKVPGNHTSGPLTNVAGHGKLSLGDGMSSGSKSNDKRRGNRAKAVLPVRVKGIDSSGKSFDELAHTLDVTPSGIRLGSIRRVLNVLDEISVFYRQRKMQFRIVWTKQLKGTSEFQVGLQVTAQEKEVWGISLPGFKGESGSHSAVSRASGAV
jgi:hypothetical protein